MKKRIGTIMFFNLGFIIAAIAFFSQKGLNLGFSLSLGAFKFALSVAIAVVGILLFFIINYKLLSSDVESMKINDTNSIDKCISQLKQAKKNNSAFIGEIDTAIKYLNTLERREKSLTQLLKTNKLTDLYDLKQTAQSANAFIFNRVNIILNSLLVFDNIEYNDFQNEELINPHKAEINKALSEIRKALIDYNNMLLAITSYIKESTNIDTTEIQAMTEAFYQNWKD